MISGSNITPNDKPHVCNAPSDHKAVIWDLDIKFPQKKKTLRIPNKKLAESITLKALSEFTIAESFLEQSYP